MEQLSEAATGPVGAQSPAQGGPAGAEGVTITVCPDGPLLVRGPAVILDAAGEAVPRRRATVALCRCGRSGIAPYCDGAHKSRGRTGAPRPRAQGGTPG